MGIMLAESQSFGKVPESSDCVELFVLRIYIFKIHVGILSGPTALPAADLRFIRRDLMPPISNVMSDMTGYGLEENRGMLLSYGTEHLLW